MSKKWILWKGIDLSKNNQKGYISSKKFKISIFSFFNNIFVLNKFKNYRGFKSSRWEGYSSRQNQICSHLEGVNVEEILIKEELK